MLAGAIFLCCVPRMRKRRQKSFARKLKKIYSNVYSKNFDVEQFIADNKDEIYMVPLDEAERSILKDRFVSRYSPNKEYTPTECCICLAEFSELVDVDPQSDAALILNYPDCNHSYHFDCIVRWLETKMDCPYCKGGIRASILRGIVNEKRNANQNRELPKNDEEVR